LIGKTWENKVAGNELSFEEVYHGNTNACPTTLEKMINDTHDNVWKSLN